MGSRIGPVVARTGAGRMAAETRLRATLGSLHRSGFPSHGASAGTACVNRFLTLAVIGIPSDRGKERAQHHWPAGITLDVRNGRTTWSRDTTIAHACHHVGEDAVGSLVDAVPGPGQPD
jgi:hypothetical protein